MNQIYDKTTRFCHPWVPKKVVPHWRQNPVLEYAQEKDLVVWSKEYGDKGKRIYRTAGIGPFADIYLDKLSRGGKLSWYEDIEADRPIKLFFDLDGKPGADLDQAVLELKEYFKPVFGRNIDALQIDSTTPVKESRHVLFMNCIVPGIDEAKFLVQKALHSLSPEVVACVDKAVYTKNRPFRLIGSHKCGKKARFRFLSWDSQPDIKDLRTIFFAHLVSWIPFECTPLEVELPTVDQMKTTNVRTIGGNSSSGTGSMKIFRDSGIITRYVKGKTCRWLKKAHTKRWLLEKIDVVTKTRSFRCYDPDCSTITFDKTYLDEDTLKWAENLLLS